MKWSAWAGHRNTCVGEVVCLFCRPSVDVDTHLGTANSAAEVLLSTWGCSLVGSLPPHLPPLYPSMECLVTSRVAHPG